MKVYRSDVVASMRNMVVLVIRLNGELELREFRLTSGTMSQTRIRMGQRCAMLTSPSTIESMLKELVKA